MLPIYAIKNRIIRDNRTFFEQEGDYYKGHNKWSSRIWYMENSLTAAISFISPKDVDDECVMHWKSSSIKFTF